MLHITPSYKGNKILYYETGILIDLDNRKKELLYNGCFGSRQCLCYTEVSFMWRLFYTVRNVIGTLGAVR